MTLKAIESFSATVDPNRATVVSFPEFIAIFGSAISFNKRYSKPKSERDAFYWWINEHRKELVELLLFPESYNDWSDFSTYSDLLLFEKDLGYLTSVVLVFLESPGSIAELGAFSQIESLSERLLVVVKDDCHPKNSFISLGPIRSIKETQKYPNCVCVVPKGTPTQLAAHIPVIVEMLDKKRADKKYKINFDANNLQHQIILVLDLVNLFLTVQKTELQKLAQLFIGEIALSRLSQILFLLEKTCLIKCKHYGNNQYFVPWKFRKIYLDYTSKTDESPFKRETTKALVWKEIQNDQYRKHVHGIATEKGRGK